jgi:hypothetical protein
MKITAILDAGLLKGKMKLSKIQERIEIIPFVLMKTHFIEEEVSPIGTITPRMRFVWWKQISKYTHIYKLEDIL